MKKILFMLTLVFLMLTGCSKDESTFESPQAIDNSTTAKQTDEEVITISLREAKQYARDNDSPTTEELDAARACITNVVGGVPSSPGSTYYTVCVIIGKKSYTVSLQYDGGELTASSVSTSGCHC